MDLTQNEWGGRRSRPTSLEVNHESLKCLEKAVNHGDF
jgi:hypothetical protein